MVCVSIESDVFQRCRPDLERCQAQGFRKVNDVWQYEQAFLDGAFHAVLTIDAAGRVAGKVIDTMTEEEYLPLRLTNPAGSYVYGVRHAYEELLRRIADTCFVRLPFASPQANRLCQRIQETWGDAPEFPWKQKAYATSGVFRHPETRKWYAAILPVSWDKVVPGREGDVELLNVKVADAAAKVTSYAGCYPAYHMNKKYWVSVSLDETMTDAAIWDMLRGSYAFAAKGRTTRAQTDGKGVQDGLAEAVLSAVAKIPKGKVATYGQIARWIGRPKNARLVGKILNQAERYGTYPCHRVVNHAGRLAPGFAQQKDRLLAEGVKLKDDMHVDLKRHHWEGVSMCMNLPTNGRQFPMQQE